MANREVKVGLRADVTPYIAAIRAAEQATSRWADRAVADATRAQTALAGAGAAGPVPTGAGAGGGSTAAASSAAAANAATTSWNQTADAMDTVGTAAAGMGAAIYGGLLLSAKAAIDWESAWAGVTKTVDGSAAEMAALESELRGMATTLPIAHDEIAGVAEAAGQLGVKREDIAGFTKTMVDLGVTTNLTAEDAATSIAQMTNVMGTAPKDVERLGATLVALGNAGASTERDIMNMSARLSGAGALIGASEAEVLAMANAMSSVGIEAELGGGSMSRTLTKMYTSVKAGGKELESFARTAGMTAEEFAAAFADDPMRAVSDFVAGLGRIKESGGNVVKALGEVKIKGTQDLQVLLRLAGASDMLAASLDLGTDAWNKNTALADEAAKRYNTVAAKLTVAKNNIVDLAIEIGDVLLPVISKMAAGITDVIQFIQGMPGPLRDVTVLLAGFGGAALLMGGMLLLTIPRIIAVRTALQTLAATAMWSNLALHFRILTTLVGGPWVVAFAAAAAAVGALLLMNRKGKRPIEDLTEAIKADTGALGQNTRATVANRLQKEGILDIADRHKIALADVTAAVLGDAEAQERLSVAVAKARAQLEAQAENLEGDARDAVLGYLLELRKLDVGVINTAEDTQRAAAAVDQFNRAAEEAEAKATAAKEALDGQFNRAMGRAGKSALATSGMAGDLARNFAAVGEEAEEAERRLKELKGALDRLLGEAFDLPEALDAWQRGLNDIRTKAKEGSRSLNRLTNEGIDNRDMFRDQARLLPEVAYAMRELGKHPDHIAGEIAKMSRELREQAAAAGYDTDKVAELTDVLNDFPPEIRTRLAVESAQAIADIDRLQARIDAVHGKTIPFTVSTARPGYSISAPGAADGGYVRGPGGPRDDAVPAWLSNGEFVVNATATSRHRGTLEHINAGRYAAGGGVGGWHGASRWLMPRTLEGVEEALEKLTDRLDKVNATLKDDKLGQVQKERREFAKSIKDAFLEAANITQLPGVGTTGAQMVHDLHGQLDRATAFTDAMAKLRKAGLNETALDQLLAAGAEGGGLDAARQILTAGNVKQVNALMGKIAAQGGKLGTREATVDFAAAERKAAAERRELLAERRMLLRQQAALVRRQKALEKAEEAAEKAEKAAKAGGKAKAVRTTSTGTTLSAVRSGGDLAAIPVKVTFDVTGADKHMRALIRHIVRTDGQGNVQKAFGT